VVGGVLAVAGSVRPLHVDLVGLIGVSVGRLSIEGRIVLLVGVMLLGHFMFRPLRLELLPIGGLSFKAARTGPILVLAGRGSLHDYLGGDVLLLVLRGVVELGIIGLVGVIFMDLCGGTAEGLIIDPISGLEKVGVVVAVC
jgi:hypothetical protein